MSTAKFSTWLNPNGTENYKCRAWVNFNGTGTVAIRAAGNVASITDNGTGDYTVNFTTAMPDANYSMVSTSGNGGRILSAKDTSTFPPTAASVRLRNTTGGGVDEDVSYAYVAIFR
jgi:hypothetical protein